MATTLAQRVCEAPSRRHLPAKFGCWRSARALYERSGDSGKIYFVSKIDVEGVFRVGQCYFVPSGVIDGDFT